MARTMNTALCWNRLVRLPAERKTWCGLIAWKMTMIRTRPATTGSIPLSPALARAAQPRTYWPRVWATTSRGTSSAATSAAAVGSDCSSGASVRAIVGPLSVRLCLGRHAHLASRGHVLDDALAVEGGGAVLRH